MTDDQHRIGQLEKASILIADTLERHATEPRDPRQVAGWLVEQLQGYGWRPPLDLTEKPPLRPAQPAGDDSPGRRAFNEARAALAARRTTAPNGHHPGK
jgi:hypothetical protein